MFKQFIDVIDNNSNSNFNFDNNIKFVILIHFKINKIYNY